MKIRRVLASLLASVFVSLVSPAASAQAPTVPMQTPRYLEGEWRFVADMQNHRARSMLCWRPSLTLTGNNLGVMWFVRMPDKSWKGWSWASPSVGDAVCSIRGLPGYADAFFDQTDLNEKALSCVAATPPIALKNGLLETDPMQPMLATMIDPTALVQALSFAGWQAAPELSTLMSESRAICINIRPIDDLLNAVEYRTLNDLQEVTPADLIRCRSGWWPCEGCDYSYTNATGTSPWVLVSSLCIAEVLRCHYSRDATAVSNAGGTESLLCFSCTANGTVVNGKMTNSEVVTPCSLGCPAVPTGAGTFVP